MDLALDFFGEGVLLNVYKIIRGLFIFLDIVLLGLFLVALFQGLKFRPKIHPSHGEVKKTYTLRDDIFLSRWKTVMEKVSSGSADSLRLAIIDADKISDDALKQMGLEGEHMADRLGQLSPDEVRSLNRLWEAHRLRNDLVHTPGFQISKEDAERALAHYEAFLKEVGFLA